MSDSIDALYEGKDHLLRLNREEKVMLFCLLSDVQLVKRNRNLIKDYMFSDPLNSLIYGAMLEVLERGAKSFKSSDLANRIIEVDNTHGSVEKLRNEIDGILQSDKEPKFYKAAHRFYENWRNRMANRKFKEVLSMSSDSEKTLEAMEEVLAIRKRPNPFAGNCKTAKEVLHSTLDMLHVIWEGKYVIPKVKTHYPELDDLLDGGFDIGSLVIMGGATGHGKSATALNIAAQMAFHGTGVQYSTLEESYRDIALKLITSQSGVA